MVKWKRKSEVLIVVVAVLFSVISAAPYLADSAEEEEEGIAALDDSIRLPKNVVPIHYDLDLVTDVHTGVRAFSGKVKIHVRVEQATNSITLHNRGLTVRNLNLTNASSGTAVAASHSFDTSRDFLIIDTDTVTLTAGQNYDLEISYTGNLRTDMGGFYRSQYQVTGETVPRYEINVD